MPESGVIVGVAIGPLIGSTMLNVADAISLFPDPDKNALALIKYVLEEAGNENGPL